MNCKTCKHWETNGFIFGWGCCQKTQRTEIDVPVDKQSLAVALHTQTKLGPARLDTHETFGCVMHEEK